MPVYVITGARTGIGLEYVRQLTESPANTVFAIVRSLAGDVSALHAIQQASPGGSNLHILECDISSATSIAALPSKILSTASSPEPLKINTLINNAGIMHSTAQTPFTLTPDALDSHMATNVLGPARTLHALLPLLAPDAVVANISSGIGSLAMLGDGRIPAKAAPYSLSKAALNMLTVHQARQLRDEGSGVVVVAIDPGHVKTEMGGPEAVLEPADSARGVLGVLAGLGEGDSGRFLLYSGVGLEW